MIQSRLPSASALALAPFFPPARIAAQLSVKIHEHDAHSWYIVRTDAIDRDAPACSATALRRIGFPHSLHLTTPISVVDVRGRAPKIFMSLDSSHDVGAEVRDSGDGEGVLGMSHEKGAEGLGDGLSLSVIVMTVTSWLH